MTMTEQKLFDLSFLEQMNDPDFIIQVLLLYQEDTMHDLKRLKHAFEATDYEQLGNIAHKLKSSTGMLQANALYVIFEQIEKIAKGRGEISLLARLVNCAEFEFEKLVSQLKIYLEEN
jgi:HPt (histidine-containing phosphotransfer) domain-containing protein